MRLLVVLTLLVVVSVVVVNGWWTRSSTPRVRTPPVRVPPVYTSRRRRWIRFPPPKKETLENIKNNVVKASKMINRACLCKFSLMVPSWCTGIVCGVTKVIMVGDCLWKKKGQSGWSKVKCFGKRGLGKTEALKRIPKDLEEIESAVCALQQTIDDFRQRGAQTETENLEKAEKVVKDMFKKNPSMKQPVDCSDVPLCVQDKNEKPVPNELCITKCQASDDLASCKKKQAYTIEMMLNRFKTLIGDVTEAED